MGGAQRLCIGAVALAISVAGGQHAHADKAAATKHATDATALAKRGDFVGAIALYKKADALAPDPDYRCRIGLAYVRLAAWHRADMYLWRCRAEWTSARNDAVPSWVARRAREVAGKLSAGNYRALSITTVPAGGWVSSSAHGDGEWLPPGAALWVPVGAAVTLRARHAGGKVVELKDYPVPDATAASVRIAEAPAAVVTEPAKTPPADPPAIEPAPKDPPTVVPVTTPPQTDRSAESNSAALPYALTIGGGALLLGGVGAHVLALGKKSDAEAVPGGVANDPAYDDLNSSFKTYRAVAIGAYAASAVGLGVGIYLLLDRDSGNSSSEPRVDASIAPGSAYVSATLPF